MSDWISVDDKTPKENLEVIICTKYGLVTTDTYFDRGYAEGFSNHDGYVTHWQPLPEPPKN